jgi:hypothetical protein
MYRLSPMRVFRTSLHHNIHNIVHYFDAKQPTTTTNDDMVVATIIYNAAAAATTH